MSLESGKKLGTVGSLIQVVIPILMIVTLAVFFVALFTSIIGSLFTPSSGLLWLPLAIIVFTVALAAIVFVGIILFVAAMNSLSNYYNEPVIFKNALYGFILNIAGGIAYGIVYFVFILGTILSSISTNGTQTVATQTPIPTVPPFVSYSFFPFLGMIIAGLALLAFSVASAYLYYKAFSKLKERSGIDGFHTAGLLILIGSIIPIVAWIGWIFAFSSFRSLKQKPAAPSAFAPPISPNQSSFPMSNQKRYCQYCGSENSLNALYCKSCGKPLQ